MQLPAALIEKVVRHVNRKRWWHVPPEDPAAYQKRGKFLASSFTEAEFWGRPLDEPQKVKIARPLIGDEPSIAKRLGVPAQHASMGLKDMAAHDARWRKAAIAKGYDAIVLMAPKPFAKFRTTGESPRSIELNILNVQ